MREEGNAWGDVKRNCKKSLVADVHPESSGGCRALGLVFLKTDPLTGLPLLILGFFKKADTKLVITTHENKLVRKKQAVDTIVIKVYGITYL